MNACRAVVQLLSGAFGCLLILAIAGSGLAMMFAPEAAKRLLKNAAMALGLFLLGWTILNYSCEVSRVCP